MVGQAPTTTGRKRSKRTSTSPDSDGEKRRGRPRVEKPDASAADRRRTQIRIAQRAYRQRKESTLDELRKRVTDLTKTIEVMNQSFAECKERLSFPDLPAESVRDLAQVAAQFEGFATEAKDPAYESGSSTGLAHAEAAQIVPQAQESQLEATVVGTSVNDWLDQAAVAITAKPRPIVTGFDVPYTEPESELVLPLESSSWIPKSKDTIFHARSQPSSLYDYNPFTIADLANTNESLFPPLGQLELPRTYSFQETTFGRRLFRAASESAYKLLMDPRMNPATFERKFKLSLLGRDKEKLIASIGSVFNKGPHEELDRWAAPLIHVGGAGTHYARRDAFGNMQPKRTAAYIGSIGPQTLAVLEGVALDNSLTNMSVDVHGFEGEWYDPFDVQGYLEEKGIFIDPTASFVEAQLPESPATSSRTSSVSASLHPLTPPVDRIMNGKELPTFTAAAGVNVFDVSNGDMSSWNGFNDAHLGTVGFSDAQMGSWMNFLQPGEGVKEFPNNSGPLLSQPGLSWDPAAGLQSSMAMEKTTTLPQLDGTMTSERGKKNVILDVSKFIQVLIVSGVCLGRSPGFRKKDVDRALEIASLDAAA